ncbi:MAG: polysaccharide deacetylase family protein [Azospirillaceae bacterium]|nr:polysaccharide deacetylase family protein [Azospirillaceae bacterium]
MALAMACLPVSGIAAEAPVTMAVTVDDLPVHGPLPPGVTRSDVARQVTADFKAAGLPPVYGFINGKGLDDEGADAAQALAIWRGAGNPLGNHTFAHDDPNKQPLAAFEAAVAANEPILKKYMGDADWHWLRFPFLNSGATPERRAQAGAYLAAHGYHVAEVTLGTEDYNYNAPYVRCLAKGDKDAVATLRQTYLQRLAQAFERSRLQSQAVFGRQVPQVLLLHIGVIETQVLPDTLAYLKAQGVTFAPLAQVEADPAYAYPPDSPETGNSNLLDRAVTAHHVTSPPPLPDIAAWLDGLCR